VRPNFTLRLLHTFQFVDVNFRASSNTTTTPRTTTHTKHQQQQSREEIGSSVQRYKNKNTTGKHAKLRLANLAARVSKEREDPMTAGKGP